MGARLRRLAFGRAKFAVSEETRSMPSSGLLMRSVDSYVQQLRVRRRWNNSCSNFQACVQAGVATLMSAFNDLNGVPASGNHFTLRQVLKGEWDFDGFVVSDWNSIIEMVPHGFAADEKEAALKGVTAGVDMEMVSTSFAEHLETLIQEGTLPIELIDEAVRRILRVKFRMEGDIIRTIRQIIKWIGHFHTAGNPGRNDMDDTQELNYTGICRAIAGTGYDLYVGHEFVPKGNVIEALRQAFALCDQG